MKLRADGAIKRAPKARKAKAMSASSAVNAVFQKYGATEVESLMPLTGRLSRPMRSRSYAGGEIVTNDLSELYCVKLEQVHVDVMKVVEELKALPEVEFAEPNYIFHALSDGTDDGVTYSDPMYSQQWGIEAINLPKLWSQPLLEGNKQVIAIIDTGVDITHPDLVDNIWTNTAEANGTEDSDDDNNGFADDVHGWDFVNQTGNMRDNNGHGTHCAGIAAATGGNGIGIVGANPNAKIMPIAVLQSDGSGDAATIIKGIDYAVANGATVISMSFGGYFNSIAEEQALGRAYHSAVLVAAAGNDCLPISPIVCYRCGFYGQPCFPGAYTFVLGVQANGQGGQAGFSNWDNDGPIFSRWYDEEKLYNYELSAPGVQIMSTYPGGRYKNMNGTSMACPLAAGAISRMLQSKEYASKELLFGDLIHTHALNMDIFAAYNITDADRHPELDFVTYKFEDDSDKDDRFDAGETIDFYPTIRNAWGQANNVKMWLTVGENEDPTIVEFLDEGQVDFGKPLSSYAKAVSENPIRFKIADRCVDGRHIKLQLHATCDNAAEEMVKDFVIDVENGVEIGNMIMKDMTLKAGVHYIVNQRVVIPEGVTLIMEPGTEIRFKPNTSIAIASTGHLIARGDYDNHIRFTAANLVSYPRVEFQYENADNMVLEYVEFDNLQFAIDSKLNLEDCIVKNCITGWPNYSGLPYTYLTVSGNYNMFYFNTHMPIYRPAEGLHANNFVGNEMNGADAGNFSSSSNFINNEYALWGDNAMKVLKAKHPSYFGSAREDIVRKSVFDLDMNVGNAKYDLSNMLKRPTPNAHALVWKVLVNGHDAQDEFDSIPPLGVGKHKFEVYYSKPVPTDFEPFIAMGVRPPYTQTLIAEDGSWNAAGDVYTAYVTITGKMAIDGLNRIYVADGKDEDYFDIPLENRRFNVEVAAAGSMSSGFYAEAGLGKINLYWEDQDENVEDILGYNVYRYEVPENSLAVAASENQGVMVNSSLLDSPEFIDYDVEVGKTYYYYYKIMRTDLSENSPSKVVAATPLTASKGDANGSTTVDVADVVTEIAYLSNQNPQPFIFEAADVNCDQEINILDVVGTINIITHPVDASIASVDSKATYSVENGVLYVESPVALGGIQVGVKAQQGSNIQTLEALSGFETVNAWTSENSMLFLAYSMSGKYLEPGKHAILNLNGTDVENVVLSDTRGANIAVEKNDVTSVSDLKVETEAKPYPNPFVSHVYIPYVINEAGKHNVRVAIYDSLGHIVAIHNGVTDAGAHSYNWNATEVPNGIYFAKLSIDGKMAKMFKLIKGN